MQSQHSTTPAAPGQQEWPSPCRSRCSCHSGKQPGSAPAVSGLDLHSASSCSSPHPGHLQSDETVLLHKSDKKADEKQGISDSTQTSAKGFFPPTSSFFGSPMWSKRSPLRQTDRQVGDTKATISYKSHNADSVSTPPPILTLSC